MRVYEGNYAYEVERIIDPRTQLESGWRYNIYRVRPVHQLLRSGESRTRQAAEQAGKRALGEISAPERGPRRRRQQTAA